MHRASGGARLEGIERDKERRREKEEERWERGEKCVRVCGGGGIRSRIVFTHHFHHVQVIDLDDFVAQLNSAWCVCVCVCERERERESECKREREQARIVLRVRTRVRILRLVPYLMLKLHSQGLILCPK